MAKAARTAMVQAIAPWWRSCCLGEDKYRHTLEDTIMDTSDRKQDSSTAGDPEAQRTVIKSALNDIAAEVGDAIRNARLNFPVYLTVPNSGDALATIVCPLDHLSDEDWSQASEIACKIIGKRLGGMRLLGRPLVCAAANPTVAAAAEVAVESIQSAGVAVPAAGA
jgi:hypothetical protein